MILAFVLKSSKRYKLCRKQFADCLLQLLALEVGQLELCCCAVDQKFLNPSVRFMSDWWRTSQGSWITDIPVWKNPIHLVNHQFLQVVTRSGSECCQELLENTKEVQSQLQEVKRSAVESEEQFGPTGSHPPQ